MKLLLPTALAILLFACQQVASNAPAHSTPTGREPDQVNPYATIGAIPIPAGYHRVAADQDPFTAWLRALRLKKDRTVYLYNGDRKRNQAAQFAVLDVSVGKADLQQCADAVMRLRAEYLYAARDLINIDFYSEQGIRLNFLEWANGGRVQLDGDRLVRYTLSTPDHFDESRPSFDSYLKTVFTWCGTHTLERQLVPKNIEKVNGGDVLIRGGAPGHAMIVVDVAEDDKGRRIFLLAQSYMPAQDIHIVVNPENSNLGPWYRADSTKKIIETPELEFKTNELRTWPRHIART